MSRTIAQARDEIYGVFTAAIATAGAPYTTYPQLFDDVDGIPPSSVVNAWFRATIRHSSGFKATVGSADGTARFRRIGTVAVQVMTKPGDGYSTSDAAVAIIMAAYERGSVLDGVWFREVRPVEQGVVNGWNQVNVLATFEYDEVK